MKALVYSNSVVEDPKNYKHCIAISLVKDGAIDIYVIYINSWNHKKLSRKFILSICTGNHHRFTLIPSSTLDIAGIIIYTYFEYRKIEVLPQFFKYAVDI